MFPEVNGEPVITPIKGTLLTALEDEGLLAPGRENKLGRGFFYRPAGPGT